MKKLVLIIVAIAVAAIGWKLGSPLFVDQMVDESLPVGFEFSEEESTMMEEKKVLMEEKEMSAEQIMDEAAKMPAKVVTEDMPKMNEPQVVAQGMFNDADDFHKGSGAVKILEANGEHLLRLEDFSGTNGPDLFVYLTKNPNPDTSEKVKEGFYNLGRLKGNQGSQNYPIPQEVDLDEYKGIAVYCRAFSVLFSYAPLE